MRPIAILDGMLDVATPLTTATDARWTRRLYWPVTGLFCLTFLVSAALTFFDYDNTEAETISLGFPAFTIYPLAVAKVCGVVVVLWRRWPVLTMFAFAGFLFDLLLALGGHVDTDDFPQGFLAVYGLALWAVAFALDWRRFGPWRRGAVR